MVCAARNVAQPRPGLVPAIPPHLAFEGREELVCHLQRALPPDLDDPARRLRAASEKPNVEARSHTRREQILEGRIEHVPTQAPPSGRRRDGTRRLRIDVHPRRRRAFDRLVMKGCC